MKEQVGSSFRFRAAEFTDIVLQKLTAVEIGLTLDSVILKQPGKELNPGRRAALPETCGNAPRLALHRLEQRVKPQRLEHPICARERRVAMLFVLQYSSARCLRL